jgi:N-methylhydantoinase B
MAKERGPAQLFDRGFTSIDELKSRCKAETSLEPPTRPEFTKWAKAAASAKTA